MTRLADDVAFAHRLADAADRISTAAFTGAAVAHRIKPDGSPVSATDEAVEARLLDMVREACPDDGFLGEEAGAHGPARGRRWVVDGIDGTVLFVAGRSGWSTQIALVVDDVPVVGVTTAPADGRRWWGSRGGGAWTAAGGADGMVGEPAPVCVSSPDDRSGRPVRCSVIPPLDALSGAAAAVATRVTDGCDYVPPHEHGALFVADGRADACLQTGGGPWDFAALAVIVEAAGGRFSDAAGAPDLHGGGPVLFSNGAAHDALLASLRG